MLGLHFLTGRMRAMATTESQFSLPQRLGQQFLGPLEEGVELARRYRDVDGLHDYVGARLPRLIPVCVLIVITAIACGVTPMMLLVGTRALPTLLGLLLTPVMLIGSLFVLTMLFFSWLEERALMRSLGRRAGPPPGKFGRWLKRKLGADLGRAPRVPWLLATLFVILPFAVLVGKSPAIAAVLLILLAAAPILYARFDR